MYKESPVDIAFLDLQEKLENLLQSKDSPKAFRKNFVQFVNLGQKLTSRIRNESGKNFEPRRFAGWNAVSELFKELRNIDEHEEAIILKTNYVLTINASAFDNNNIKRDANFEIKYNHDWDDPLANTIEKRLQASFIPGNGKITMKEKGHRYDFVLDNKQDHIINYLKKIGFSDVVKLSEAYFRIIKKYYNYYKKVLKQNHNYHRIHPSARTKQKEINL